MKPQQMKLAFTAVWMVLAVVVIAAAGHLTTMSDMVLLTAVAVAPPAAMWLWWHGPDQTLSESIQNVRGNDTGKTPR